MNPYMAAGAGSFGGYPGLGGSFPSPFAASANMGFGAASVGPAGSGASLMRQVLSQALGAQRASHGFGAGQATAFAPPPRRSDLSAAFGGNLAPAAGTGPAPATDDLAAMR